MTVVETLWWLTFFGAFGACVGSFLNVVIYRLPRDISLRDPLWSFCPGCTARIHWYDNLPVVSYVLLGGKCRRCRMSIAPRYPTVEILGALVVLLVFDAFFIAHAHVGLGDHRDNGFGVNMAGLTWQLAEDWPILLAHVVLFTSLLAMSAIDMQHYWVDVRFTTFAAGAGFLFHALWTPVRYSQEWHRPSLALGAGAVVATVVWIITLGVLRARYRDDDIGATETEAAPSPYEDLAKRRLASFGVSIPDEEPTQASPGASAGWGYAAAIGAAATLLILVYGAFAESTGIGAALPAAERWLPAMALLFVFIVGSAATQRESDHEIVAAIEAERTTARQVAATELLCLLPAILLGGLAVYLVSQGGGFANACEAAVAWQPVREWAPGLGIATAAAGFVIGAGIGWLVRVAATLVLGREAFGTGDIHMMAAAGCVAGWPVVLIGFLLCSFLALGGWVLTLPFKRSRAIPLGPWLSIGFLIVVLFYDRILAAPMVTNVVYLWERL